MSFLGHSRSSTFGHSRSSTFHPEIHSTVNTSSRKSHPKMTQKGGKMEAKERQNDTFCLLFAPYLPPLLWGRQKGGKKHEIPYKYKGFDEARRRQKPPVLPPFCLPFCLLFGHLLETILGVFSGTPLEGTFCKL